MPRKKTNTSTLTPERMRIFLKQEHLTQSELAEQIHISQQTISKIMNGKAPLIRDNAELIHSLYPAYSVAWLLGDAEYQNEEEQRIQEHLASIQNKQNKQSKRFDIFYMIGELSNYQACYNTERFKKNFAERLTGKASEKVGFDIEINKDGESIIIPESEIDLLVNVLCDSVNSFIRNKMKQERGE